MICRTCGVARTVLREAIETWYRLARLNGIGTDQQGTADSGLTILKLTGAALEAALARIGRLP